MKSPDRQLTTTDPIEDDGRSDTKQNIELPLQSPRGRHDKERIDSSYYDSVHPRAIQGLDHGDVDWTGRNHEPGRARQGIGAEHKSGEYLKVPCRRHRIEGNR